MATITTNTFLDGGTARTAGETWTISDGALTVRTDTRWHANAPASMTGTFGNFAINTGGSLYVTGLAVRWMAFDTGTGTVPAIGTAITQGGVTGYLLGVWASIDAAPTAVGAAMPAMGFLKFREVTAGPYTVGALTGIGANATAPDVTGWIEVVLDSTAALTIQTSNKVAGHKTRGDWFYLDNTTGVAGQIISTPINGGGALSLVPGVQIETSPGSNIFEWYSAVENTNWTSAYKPAADARTKLVGALASGQIIIGHNGVSATSYTPPAGCRVRMPNIIFRFALSATRNTNNNVATYINAAGRFNNSTGVGVYDLDKAMFCIAIDANASYQVSMTDCVFYAARIMSVYNSVILTNCARGQINTGYSSGEVFALNSNLGSVSVNGMKLLISQTNNSLSLTPLYNALVNNLEINYINTTNSAPITLALNGTNSTFTTTQLVGVTFSISHGNAFNGTDYIEKAHGITTTTGSSAVFTFLGNDVKIDGLTFGKNGTISGTHPYASGGIVSVSAGSYGHIVRNFGSYSAPLQCGADATTQPNYIFSTGTNSGNPNFVTKFQRLYVSNTRTAVANALDNTFKNYVIESISGPKASGSVNATLWGQGVTLRNINYGIAYDVSNYSASGAAGTNFLDYRQASTNGAIYAVCLPVLATNQAYVTTNFNSSNSFIDVGGTCYLAVTNDYIIIECPHYIYGHTRLAPSAITVTSSGVTSQFQYDAGAGWNGTWTTLTTANLFNIGVIAEKIKLKFKFTATSNSLTNYARKVYIPTTVSASLVAPPYPLDTVSLGFTNLVAGSEVRVYTGSDPTTATEIGGVESTAGSTFSFSHSSGGVAGVIAIFALGYQPIYLPYTFKTTDDSILIQQTIDRNYVNL